MKEEKEGNERYSRRIIIIQSRKDGMVFFVFSIRLLQ
jgi:hypothetical protein